KLSDYYKSAPVLNSAGALLCCYTLSTDGQKSTMWSRLCSYYYKQKRGVEIGGGRIRGNNIRFIETLPD
ncbi:MAG: hypothetical protein OXH03_06880, partial [Bacteroidetes bacterium]|nr:hypothetical protein [Bacteroidota bacterium]MDE2671585.1 hypothetical protein [Bacteroidota bacterium]